MQKSPTNMLLLQTYDAGDGAQSLVTGADAADGAGAGGLVEQGRGRQDAGVDDIVEGAAAQAAEASETEAAAEAEAVAAAGGSSLCHTLRDTQMRASTVVALEAILEEGGNLLHQVRRI